MSEPVPRLLLDTHALLWTIAGELSASVTRIVDATDAEAGLCVSPISIWEIGMLFRKPPPRRLVYDGGVAGLISKIRARSKFVEVPISTAIAAAVDDLAEALHPDPADRFLVATAQVLGIPIMTRDRAILAYAKTGAVRAIAC